MTDAENIGPTRLVLEPASLAVYVARNLSPWYHDVPDVDVMGKLHAVKVSCAWPFWRKLTIRTGHSRIAHFIRQTDLSCIPVNEQKYRIEVEARVNNLDQLRLLGHYSSTPLLPQHFAQVRRKLLRLG